MNDPHDPGGETNFGISKRSYPNLDIRNLTADDAVRIYRQDYWLPAGCDKLPAPLALLVFDTAVNMGLGAAAKLLAGNPSLEEFCTRRILRYASLNTFPLYGRTWVRRTFDAYKLALSLPS